MSYRAANALQGIYDEDHLPEDRVERKRARKDKSDKGDQKASASRPSKCASAALSECAFTSFPPIVWESPESDELFSSHDSDTGI